MVTEDERCTTEDGACRMGSQSSARSASTQAVPVVISGTLGRCDCASCSNSKGVVGRVADSGSSGLADKAQVRS